MLLLKTLLLVVLVEVACLSTLMYGPVLLTFTDCWVGIEKV